MFPLCLDIDDCTEHGCVNGRCIDGINSYTCDCTGTGFAGEQCEQGYTLIIIKQRVLRREEI